MSLLTASSIRKSFAGVKALKGVSFDLAPGEAHALVGENGAGKSTLIKILAGAERADAGTLEVNGAAVPLEHMTPSVARQLGIAVIHQQPALFPDLTVSENIAIALDGASSWRPIAWRARRARAAELLDRAGARIDPEQLAGTLSMPEQQLVEIAKALGANARIILMDEPTAALADREVEHLFAVIASLRRDGAGVIYISHRLDEVFAIADRITVLRDGGTITTAPRGTLERSDVVRHMAGRELSTAFPARLATPGDVALEVRDLSSRSAGIRNISLSVRRGEILGVSGLVGSGRTEMAEALFGLRSADSGEILVNGSPASLHSPADAVRCGIAYVPEDRRRHGVVLDMSVAANTSMASLHQVSRRGMVNASLERTLASGFVRDLQVKTPSTDVPVGHLSGGNQQKIALARWLATNPSVLILDEPTQGVDVGAKAEIHGVMRAMVERGMAIIMISSDLPEVLGMSDRIMVMRSGRVAGVISREEATAESVLALALERRPQIAGAH